MHEFKRKREIRKKIYSKTAIFILLIILLFLLNGVWGIYQKTRQSREKLGNSEARLEELDDRRESIESKIENLENETGIEEEIRSKYSFAKDGEDVIVIIEHEPQPEELKEEGFLGDVKNWLGF